MGTAVCTLNLKGSVIPQIRTYTRYEMGSVVMFDCAESPSDTDMRLLTACREFLFRTDMLTRLVPAPVRFVLRNDRKDKQ